MDKISEISISSTFNEDEWIVPVAPKIKDNRGFIYGVFDTCYPTLIKIGRTQDFVKRVKQYNNDRPFENVIPLFCTDLVANCDWLERNLINRILEENFCSVGKSQEWFNRNALELVYNLLGDTSFYINYTVFNRLPK